MNLPLNELATDSQQHTLQQEILDRLVQVTARALHAPMVKLTLADKTHVLIRSQLGLGELTSIPVEGSLARLVIEHRETVAVPDIDELSPSFEVSHLGVRSFAGVPLVEDQQPYGALIVMDKRVRHWTAYELDLLRDLGKTAEQEFAYIAMLALVQKQEGALRQKTQLLEAILGSMEEGVIAQSTDGAVIAFNRAIAEMHPTWPATGIVSPCDDHVHQLYLPDGKTPYSEDQLPGNRALRGETVPMTEVLVKEPATEPRWEHMTARPLHGPDGEVSGVVTVVRDITKLKQTEEALRELALRDEATSLHNRRGFRLLAERCQIESRRSKHPFAIFYIDVNGMKTINDNQGHSAGDQALVHIAQVLLQTFREVDVVARLGGDEFAVAVGNCSVENAEQLRSRLLSRLEGYRERERMPYQLSISVGYVVSDAEDQRSLEELLKVADAHMYQAKAAQRAARHQN